MKAIDLKKELSKINKKHWDIIFANPKEYSKLYEAYISEIQELMIKFAKAKCKEQRYICASKAEFTGANGIEYDSIENAPTPDFK